MTPEERFQKACNEFQPRDDDNPDCIPYYRDWAGVRAVVGEASVNKFNWFIHNSMFYASPSHTWQGIKCGMKVMLENTAVPEKPSMLICWAVEPSQDVEARAYEMFKAQFKQAFPRRRLNSKFAKEKWEEKRELAMKFAKENFDKEIERYQREVDRVDSENTKILRKWQNSVYGIALLEKFVRELP